MAESRWTGEAPGRLDVLGGVADYSGSLVLQTPIEATTRVTITPIDEPIIRGRSGDNRFEVALGEVLMLREMDAPAVRTRLDALNVPSWARYPLGCLLLFSDTTQWWPSSGLMFEIESNVPTSMGVSSSAALEIATVRALEQMADIRLEGTQGAKLAQRAENEIVGAPCGLMDQLASAHGARGALLPILCRPDTLFDPVFLPEDIRVVGWPSGVKHAVADSPYAVARAAAFMGKKILEAHFGYSLDYLTELAPSQVRGVNEEVLLPQMRGREFIARFGGVDDALSVIEPERLYPIRDAALFPVEENFRCDLAMQLLRGDADESTLRTVGELMFQSHAGYSSIGLGHVQTDAMVEVVRGMPDEFYGARVSGGGSGGTVVVLLRRDALPALESLRQQFQTPALIF